MPSSLKQLSLHSLLTVAMLLALSGCGGDGRNASDNPSTAPQLVSSGGPGGDTTVTPLPEAGAPRAIDSEDLGSVETAKAVMDGNGNIMVAWTQSDSARINLWASRYTVTGNAWSTPQKLENGSLDVKSFQLVADANGNVTVVWSQATPDVYMSGSTLVNVERTDLWAKRFLVAGGWDSEVLIEQADLSASATQNIEDIGEFQLAVNGGAGDVSVVWTQHNGSHYDLYANRNVGGAWGTPVLLDSDAGDVTAPQLVVDGSGNLFALWTQSDNTRLNLWGAHYAAAAWSAAAKIDSEDLGDVDPPVVVVDSSGEATVAWRQFNGSSWNLWTARYAGGWGAAALAETQAGDVSTPQLLLYGGTKVMLLWDQSDGVVNNIWSNQYNGVWAASTTITTGAGNAGSATMVKDGAGVVTAAWIQRDSSGDSLWANRFSSNSWGSATLIETRNDGDVRSPMLLVDSSSRVSAIWLQQQGGHFDLWSNHFVSGSWGTTGLVEGLDGSAVDPHAAMSSSGDITLAWRQPYGSANLLVTSKYTAAAPSGWGSVAQVESQTSSGGGNAPLLLVDGSGMVSVIWLQPVVVNTASTQDIRIDLWANRF